MSQSYLEEISFLVVEDNPFMRSIIMLSAHSEHNRVLEARDAGVNEFVVKPISAKSLFKRIQQVIESPRPFVRSKTYCGTDRRRHAIPYHGKERRKNQPETVPGPDDEGY